MNNKLTIKLNYNSSQTNIYQLYRNSFSNYMRNTARLEEIEEIISQMQATNQENFNDCLNLLNSIFQCEDQGTDSSIIANKSANHSHKPSLINNTIHNKDNIINTSNNNANNLENPLKNNNIVDFSFKAPNQTKNEIEESQDYNENDSSFFGDANSFMMNSSRKATKTLTEKGVNPLIKDSSNKKRITYHFTKTVSGFNFQENASTSFKDQLKEKIKQQDFSSTMPTNSQNNYNIKGFAKYSKLPTTHQNFNSNLNKINIDNNAVGLLEGDLSSLINQNNIIQERKNLISSKSKEKLNFEGRIKKGKVSIHKDPGSLNSKNINEVEVDKLNSLKKIDEEKEEIVSNPIISNNKPDINIKIKKPNLLDENQEKIKAESNPFKKKFQFKPKTPMNKVYNEDTNTKTKSTTSNTDTNNSVSNNKKNGINKDNNDTPIFIDNNNKSVNSNSIEDRLKNLVKDNIINKENTHNNVDGSLFSILNIGIRGGSILFSSDFKLCSAYQQYLLEQSKI